MIINTDEYGRSGIHIIWFSGGEPHVAWTNPPRKGETHAHIYAKLRNAKDVLGFLAVCSSLKEMGIATYVFMPYIPGMRQDRVQANGAYTAKLYAQMFRPVVDHITTYDPHSVQAASCYISIFGKDYSEVPFVPVIKGSTSDRPYDALICPDAGAVQRTTALAEALNMDESQIVYAKKHRDPSNGAITLEVEAPRRSFKHALLADDICDGGGTFIAVAEQLRNDHGVGADIDLYVSHGIFSKGLEPLAEEFSMVITTDSFMTSDIEVPVGMDVRQIQLFTNYQERLTP